MPVTKRIQEQYSAMLIQVGENSFLNHVFQEGVLAKNFYEHPEITMLEQSESFFALFRTTGDAKYFTIGKLLRRAAHKLYRNGKRKNPNYPSNKKFLDVIK
jgi:hypothetical protein